MDVKIEFLPKDVKDPLFEQRESGRAHTPYEVEVEFYSCIERGDVKAVQATMSMFLGSSLIVGRMSNDNLRQAKYFAVSCITLATRYAIVGGVEQSIAYNLSDSYILHIDGLSAAEEIFAYLTEKALELTRLVSEEKRKKAYPLHVRKGIKFINIHLHEKLDAKSVARECGVSKDYLSAQFKKYIGDSLNRYILRQKLNASKKLLLYGNYNCGDVAYIFGFCSETYYITCFKKEYGITPKQYVRQNTVG